MGKFWQLFKPGPFYSHICPAFANSAAPGQLASSEASWSGSSLFVIQNVNLYQQPGSSNPTGW